METERLLRLRDVCDRVGLRRSALYKRIRAGEFPAPVRLGSRSVAWKLSDIARWIDERPSARSAE